MHFLGEVAQLSEIQEAILVNADSLQKDDPVWVKRSDKSWTYAIVKDRENGPISSIVVVVHSQGDTKKLTLNQSAKYLRKVANNDNDDDSKLDNDDDLELDKLMTFSNNGSYTSCKTSDEVSVEYSASMRTVLFAKEMYHYNNNDCDAGQHIRRHEDFAQTRSRGLQSKGPNGGKIQDRSLLDAINCCCRKRGGEYCTKSLVNTSKWPESSSLKPSIQKHQSLHDIDQSKRHVSFRLNDEPKPQQQRSWVVYVEKIADGLLKIPAKKLNDLDMEEILPQARKTIDADSFHHPTETKNFQSSKLSSSLLEQDKCTTEGKPQCESSTILRQKMSKVSMRDNMSQSKGQARFDSFHHALQSIHPA